MDSNVPKGAQLWEEVLVEAALFMIVIVNEFTMGVKRKGLELRPELLPSKKRRNVRRETAKRKDLKIKPIKTSKDKIKQPELAADENMYIAPIGSSVIISGKSGSGKSTLLVNLLQDKRFYKGFFDRIFWISPTASGDDIQKTLNIDKKDVFTDLEEAPEVLQVILEAQADKLAKGDGAHTVEQYAIVFDDVIGDVQFMNSPEFTKCFYQVRHVNCTTFICTQHFKRVPRICRLQANFVHFFQGSQTEVETVVEEFAPPCYSKNEFRQVVHDATKENFSFLTINMKLGWDKRFRKNLDEFIPLERLYGDQCDTLLPASKDGGHEQTTDDAGQEGDRTREGADGDDRGVPGRNRYGDT